MSDTPNTPESSSEHALTWGLSFARGYLELGMFDKAAHELDIIPRVLALGSDAELIAPAECRRQVAEMVKQMAAKYADG